MFREPPRTYKITELPPGQKGTVISDIAGDDRTEFLHLPEGTAPETQHDVVTAIQRAYRQGWEDRGICPADVEDLTRNMSFTGRASARAQQAAHDAATAISHGDHAEARSLLQEAIEALDKRSEYAAQGRR